MRCGRSQVTLAGVGLAALSILSSCFWEDDTWSGWVYPNANNLMVDHFVGAYSTLESCRSAALSMIESNGWANADYECGLNCRDKGYINVCEKTLR